MIDEYCHNPAIERESPVKGLNTVMDGSNQSSAHMVNVVIPLSAKHNAYAAHYHDNGIVVGKRVGHRFSDRHL